MLTLSFLVLLHLTCVQTPALVLTNPMPESKFLICPVLSFLILKMGIVQGPALWDCYEGLVQWGQHKLVLNKHYL